MDRRSFLLGAAATGIGAAWWTGSIPERTDVLDAAGNVTNSTDEPERADTDSEQSGRSDFTVDQASVEEAFRNDFNAMRREQNLQVATIDSRLSNMGQAHAENMAEHDYIGHEQPDGTTIEDRYQERGLLGECRLPVPGDSRYYPGAENAAGAAMGQVTHPGTDKFFNVQTDADLAEFLMSSWMSSDGHRRVMTLPAVRRIGLGVAARSEEQIYAALEFC